MLQCRIHQLLFGIYVATVLIPLALSEMECSEPPSISNGYYTVKTGINDRIVIGSTATYSCDVGYQLENDTAAVLTCELDVKTNSAGWSNLTLRCVEMERAESPPISNGSYTMQTGIDDLKVNRSTATYSCDVGYQLENETAAVVTCELDLKAKRVHWSNLTLRCLEMECAESPSVLNGSYTMKTKKDDQIVNGSTATCLCDIGYQLENETAAVLTCELDLMTYNVHWSNLTLRCLEMECAQPPSISNGYYAMKTEIDDRIIIGSTATYACDVGYQLENETTAVLTCELDLTTNSAHWSNLTLRCIERQSCPDPGVSVDGEREGDCCFIRDVVKYSCNEGFELVGVDTLVCLPYGKWSSLRPLCRPLDDHCDLPPFITHGAVVGWKEGDFYLPYDEVEIICEPGFKYQGSEDFNFCENGTGWEYDFSECEEFFCDPPEPLENGSIPEVESTNITAFPYNFDITYVCNKGFRLIGDSWRFCDRKGWSRETPHCEEIQCPDPGLPENGYRRGRNFEIGSKVNFSCFTGYHLIGSFERYCMPNGQWSGELARCDSEDNYCPDPGIPVNGMKNSSRYDMGSKIGFHCKPGYTLMGSDVIECFPNRTWSGTEIKCVGPYEYDDAAQVGEILKLKVKEIAEEQRRELMENPELPFFWERFILYFVFDMSGSMKEHNFNRSRDFAKAIVKKVGISKRGARAGAVAFSQGAEIALFPSNYRTTGDFFHALDEIKYTGGGTATSTALTALRENLIPSTEAVLGVRGQKSIIFILTDGRVNMKGDPTEEATRLKEAGVEIYSIGIASNILRESLVQIASDPKKEHVFILRNYAVFDWLIQEIANRTIDYSLCGLDLEHLRVINRQAKVAGGKQATEPWPWMAALRITPKSGDPEEAGLSCGGSIIHKHYILTAAHCLYYKNVEERRKENQVTVYLGITDVNNKASAQVFDVKKFYIHEKYRNDKSFDYDIALLKLKRPVEFNAFVRPICLPSANLPQNNTLYKPKELALAAGWRQEGTAANGEKPNFKQREHLKEVILILQSRENCLKFINKMKKESFSERMLCATGDEIATWQGNSGGPLMQSQQDADGNVYWTQVGITSWGFSSGVSNTYGFYGFYSHVQNLVSWVTETIANTISE